MKELLLVLFITLIVAISLFGYFHFENRSVEMIEPEEETVYKEL